MLTAELTDLYTAYSVAFDSLDPVALEKCFTQDAVIDSPVRAARGMEEILNWMALSRLGVVHQSFNIMVVGDSGSDIRCRANWHIYEAGALIATGTYQDVVRRSGDGGLRFQKRSIIFSWSLAPLPGSDQQASE